MKGALVSVDFKVSGSFFAARAHTEQQYFQSAVGNQVLTNSCSLVAALIIRCHVSVFSRNTTVSNYRHFPGLNSKWNDCRQKAFE